jgi:hypothetical protein
MSRLRASTAGRLSDPKLIPNMLTFDEAEKRGLFPRPRPSLSRIESEIGIELRMTRVTSVQREGVVLDDQEFGCSSSSLSEPSPK